MNVYLRALAAFLRDVCHPCRAVDRVVDRMVSEALDDDLTAVMDATAEPPFEPVSAFDLRDDSPLYHAVVSEMAEALADLRVAAFGDEDIQEWERELAHMAEGADE